MGKVTQKFKEKYHSLEGGMKAYKEKYGTGKSNDGPDSNPKGTTNDVNRAANKGIDNRTTRKLAKAEVIKARAERTRARQGAAKTRSRAAALSSSVRSLAEARQATAAQSSSLTGWNSIINGSSSNGNLENTTGSDAPGDSNTDSLTNSANSWFWGSNASK